MFDPVLILLAVLSFLGLGDQGIIRFFQDLLGLLSGIL